MKPNPNTWADYLVHGLSDHTPESFWLDHPRIPTPWEGLSAELAADTTTDARDEEMVMDDYLDGMFQAVDKAIPKNKTWGVLLSGGVDSSMLLYLADALDSECPVFTFTTTPDYDETRFAREIIGNHPWTIVQLTPEEVPALAREVHFIQDRQPYGGIPTLAMYKMFQQASREGVEVLLDGNGLDEQWGGYSYYTGGGGVVQSANSPTRPDCLVPEFRALAHPLPEYKTMRAMQIRDITQTKFPRCIRFNNAIAKAAGVELASPFMDVDLIKFALRQPDDRKIRGGVHKFLQRKMAAELGLPASITAPAKRAVQTPQREWLRGELKTWSTHYVQKAIDFSGHWLDLHKCWETYLEFIEGKCDNAFFIWQWISLGMLEAYG